MNRKASVADKADALDRALKIVRNRIDEFGVSEPLVQRVGTDRIIVELPGIDDPERAQQVVEKTAYLQFMITDESNALERALTRLDQIAKEVGGPASAGALGDTARRAQSGLDKLFTLTQPRKGSDSTKTDSARSAIPPTGGPISGILQRGEMPGEYYIADARTSRAPSTTSRFRRSSRPSRRARRSSGVPTRFRSAARSSDRFMSSMPARSSPATYIQDAKPNNSPIDGTVVEFQLDNEGGRRFRTETAKHIQDYMAIVLDDRVMGRPPVIQSAIGTRGQITLGRGNIQQAQDLALVLRAGALPVR